MKLKNIETKNFKGFDKCNIEFHKNLNVFIGNNASGKTSLLNAILKSLYGITKQFATTYKRNELLELKETDIKYDANFSTILSSFYEFQGYDNLILSHLHTGLDNTALQEKKIYNQSLNNFVKWFKNIVSNTTVTVPIIKFYPANRWLEYTTSRDERIFLISQLETWSNIYQDSVSYSRFFNWFLENESNELRLQRDLGDFSKDNPSLSNVRFALSKAFDFIGYKNIVVKSHGIKRRGNSSIIPTLILENTITKKQEFLDNKSDGEKAIIALIADIAYNLSLAKDFSIDNDFLSSPGIVLIDEIETHLHPSWQRQVIPMLTNIFPNIQFFITTHSPQIISSVKSESVYLCDNFRISNINLKTKGEDSNSLLKHIFNSTERPLQYVDLVHEFNSLIDNNADDKSLEDVISKIRLLEEEDSGNSISILIDELNLQLEAYKFDKEYEKNN